MSAISEPLLPYASGILATRAIIDAGVKGIGSQFREDAAVYQDRYYDSESKIVGITRGLRTVDVLLSGQITALDIGCGPGDATFAILKMFPGAHVYATDLSPEMLDLLMSYARSIGVADQITAFIADASAVALSDHAFDLVVGSSMIHHLLDPNPFMDRILRSIRPCGAALFYEPFQAGHIVLRTLFASILQIAPYRPGLSERRAKFFSDYIITIDAMCREERDPIFYASLDDKWMFPIAVFRDAAKRNGCRVEIFGTNPLENTFAIKIADLLRQGLGDTDPLPEWCHDLIAETDRAISRPLKDELLIEGCVAFARQEPKQI